MIGLHSHILPGVDDGPDSLPESMEMPALAQNSGTTLIASDGHDTYLRTPVLNEAFTVIANKYGIKKAEQLFILNPAEAVS